MMEQTLPNNWHKVRYSHFTSKAYYFYEDGSCIERDRTSGLLTHIPPPENEKRLFDTIKDEEFGDIDSPFKLREVEKKGIAVMGFDEMRRTAKKYREQRDSDHDNKYRPEFEKSVVDIWRRSKGYS